MWIMGEPVFRAERGLCVSHAVRDRGDVVAEVSAANLLQARDLQAFSAGLEESAPVVVCRSGWTEEGLSWMPGARGELSRALTMLVPELHRRGRELWLWPGAAHVLSDAPSTMSFVRTLAEARVGVLFDPASLLTREMLAHSEEHLERLFELFASLESVRATLLANIEPEGGVEGVRLRALHRGALSPGLLAGLWRRHLAHLPLIVLDEDVAGQEAVVGSGG